MKLAAFNATCPFEIGDKVYVVGSRMCIVWNREHAPEHVKTITDIACVHFVRSGAIQFRYELDGSGEYVGFTTPPAEKVSEVRAGGGEKVEV